MAITTAKAIYAQAPVFDADGNVSDWREQQAWGYVTAADKDLIMPDARKVARACGGRVIQVTTTTDNHDSTDETTWDVTVASKVLVSRVTTSATVTAPKDQMARALPAVQAVQGCKAFADAIAAAIA